MFVVDALHMVRGIAPIMAVFGGSIIGIQRYRAECSKRRLLGQFHFWVCSLGTMRFLPQALYGLLGMPRRYHENRRNVPSSLQPPMTSNALMSVGGLNCRLRPACVLFKSDLERSRAKRPAGKPWGGESLEWKHRRPRPGMATGARTLPIVYRWAYEQSTRRDQGFSCHKMNRLPHCRRRGPTHECLILFMDGIAAMRGWGIRTNGCSQAWLEGRADRRFSRREHVVSAAGENRRLGGFSRWSARSSRCSSARTRCAWDHGGLAGERCRGLLWFQQRRLGPEHAWRCHAGYLAARGNDMTASSSDSRGRGFRRYIHGWTANGVADSERRGVFRRVQSGQFVLYLHGGHGLHLMGGLWPRRNEMTSVCMRSGAPSSAERGNSAPSRSDVSTSCC